jgi:hypothetical protein
LIEVPVDDRSVHNPNSPIGQIEQISALADGLTRLTGRRREIARWTLLICIALPGVAFVLAQILH